MDETKTQEVIVDPEPEVVNNDPKAALREKNKLKKRKSRAKQKAEKDAEKAEARRVEMASWPNEQWWAHNRKDLTAKQQAEYAEREDEVISLGMKMENVVFARLDRLEKRENAEDEKYLSAEYRESDVHIVTMEHRESKLLRKKLEQYLQEGLVEAEDLDLSDQQVEELKARVVADIEKHGEILGGIVDRADFASMREHFDSWCSGDKGATRIYITFGYITALHDYGAFFRVTAPPGYVQTCSECNATVRVPGEPVLHWRCVKCVSEQERKAADLDAQLAAARKVVQAPDFIFDAFGRVKT